MIHPHLSALTIDIFTILCLIGITFFVYIGWIDMTTQKIRNKTLLYLLPFTVIHLFFPPPIGAGASLALWSTSIIQPLILFALLFIGYAIKTMGAGDAKYGFVIGLWLSPHSIIEFIMISAILTLLVLGPMVIFQRLCSTDKYLLWASKYPKLLLIRNKKVFCAYGPFMSCAAIYITLKWLYAIKTGQSF